MTDRKPITRAAIFKDEIRSLNNQKLHRIGIIRDKRWAISVFIIPEFFIAKGKNMKIPGNKMINGKTNDHGICVKLAGRSGLKK